MQDNGLYVLNKKKQRATGRENIRMQVFEDIGL